MTGYGPDCYTCSGRGYVACRTKDKKNFPNLEMILKLEKTFDKFNKSATKKTKSLFLFIVSMILSLSIIIFISFISRANFKLLLITYKTCSIL